MYDKRGHYTARVLCPKSAVQTLDMSAHPIIQIAFHALISIERNHKFLPKYPKLAIGRAGKPRPTNSGRGDLAPTDERAGNEGTKIFQIVGNRDDGFCLSS